jgi:hypothetical protein
MESYLSTSWIEPATATTHQKLMENVATMENAGKCVSYTKQPVKDLQSALHWTNTIKT